MSDEQTYLCPDCRTELDRSETTFDVWYECPDCGRAWLNPGDASGPWSPDTPADDECLDDE